MFTLDQIKAAHSKVKSGADFPAYVQAIELLGVRSFDLFVSDGHTTYYGKDGFALSAPAAYPVMVIAMESSSSALNAALKIHQQGATDYRTFCREAAAAGAEKWTVDINSMTCTYYDQAGREMIAEEIPMPV